MKRSVILTDRLGPNILLLLTMKRQVLHRKSAHLKVPSCSLVLSTLLTKKLPTFLTRLNEILVEVAKQFHQSRDHFKIIKNDTFYCVIMRMESEGKRNSVILIFL